MDSLTGSWGYNSRLENKVIFKESVARRLIAVTLIACAKGKERRMQMMGGRQMMMAMVEAPSLEQLAAITDYLQKYAQKPLPSARGEGSAAEGRGYHQGYPP